jgi:hypothetical protein
MTEQINVADTYTSHDTALEWTADPAPIERYVAQIETMLGELDGRHVKSPQAQWARQLLRPELKAAQKYRAARQKAVLAVEPSRESFRVALDTARAAEEACDTAFAAGDASGLVLARAQRDMRGAALMAARRAFAGAIRTISDVRSECTLGECVRAWQEQSAPDWGTKYLAAHAHVIDRWQPFYFNTAHDAATKQGAQYSIFEMIAAVVRESDYIIIPDCAATFAVRWQKFARTHNIAIEPAAAVAEAGQ